MSSSRILFMLAVFAAASIYFAVTDGPGDRGSEKQPHADVVPVHVGDPEMNAAIDRARSTVGAFVERLPALQASGASVSIKFPLTENGETEHVWVGNPRIDGRNFTGYLASVPVNLPSWSQGDRISVPIEDISDWMALTGGTLYGGFTIHVVHDRMPPGEQRAMAARMGIKFPDRPVVWN